MQIYDNGGKTFDRYAVIKSGYIWHMSLNAGSPQGVCTYCGPAQTINCKSLGQRLHYKNVPKSVLDVVCNLAR